MTENRAIQNNNLTKYGPFKTMEYEIAIRVFNTKTHF